MKFNFFSQYIYGKPMTYLSILIRRKNSLISVFLTVVVIISCYYQLFLPINSAFSIGDVAFNSSIFASYINCKNILLNDTREQEIGKNSGNLQSTLSSEKYIKLTKNCKLFLEVRGYLYRRSWISQSELEFPIAFAILLYKDIGQFERLLRAIYRPQNIYCLHADSKMDTKDFRALQCIVSCLSSNVFIATKRINIKWGRFSVLEADLLCMKELWDRRSIGWKYYFNLAGQEFPLRTNRELVEILKIYNGSNNIEGTVLQNNPRRIPKRKINLDIVWTKGALHVTASIGFVEFALKDFRAKYLLYILREGDKFKWHTVPDEQFYATLNHNPKTLPVPGAYLGTPETDWRDPKLENVSSEYYPFITRLTNWGSYPCKSNKWVRGLCIWGVEDLPYIIESPKLFINKFYYNFQPAALDCLEEHYWNKVKSEIQSKTFILNSTFYKKLVFVKNHL